MNRYGLSSSSQSPQRPLAPRRHTEIVKKIKIKESEAHTIIALEHFKMQKLNHRKCV